jgi:hypothetical protein
MRSRTFLLSFVVASALLLMAMVPFVLDFSNPIEISSQTPDYQMAAKPKLMGMSSGRLIAVYNDAVENDPSRYVYDTKGDELRPARDVFARYCESKTTDCSLAENWTAPVNLSNTALLSSMDADWDGDLDADTTRKPYMGDSEKANVFNAGNRAVVTWLDAYCPDGDPVAQGMQATLQRSVTYQERHDREVPFKCLWAAWSANGGISWAPAIQLSNAIRDAKQDVHRGLGSGHWGIVWQEDPLGLALGEADGPGDGASGANTSNGTDIWYAYADPAWADADPNDGLGIWHAPLRLTDNATATVSGGGERDLVRDTQGVEVQAADLEAGIAGASRANFNLVDDSARSGKRIAVVAYEESKGGQGEDEGKFIRMHTFTWNQPQAANPAGCLISDPMETSRRVRVVTQTGVGKANGLRMAIFWRQGTISQGGPADIMLRMGYASQTDTAVSGLGFGQLLPAVDPACETSDYPQALVLQNRPGLNISSDTPNANRSNLADTTGANFFESARAHRAVLRGDDLHLGWTWTNDSVVAQATNLANYNFWVRSYDDVTGDWRAPINLSQVSDVGIDVREPRLMGMPGNGPGCTDPANPTDPSDCQAKSTLVAAWGTAKNVYEHIGGAVDYEIYYTKSTDKGVTFAEKTAVPGRGNNARSETQMRISPDGNSIASIWSEKSAVGSNAIFSMANPIPPRADVMISGSVKDTRVARGATVKLDMNVMNRGPQVAYGVVATATLPAGMEMAGVPDCPVSGKTMSCTLAVLHLGESRSYSFSAKATDAGSHSVMFAVSGATDDPVQADNDQLLSINVMTDPTTESSGGGCVMNTRSATDPMLPLLLLLALAAAGIRGSWRKHLESTKCE